MTKDEARKYVSKLSAMAAGSNDRDDALKFSQAALNVANASFVFGPVITKTDLIQAISHAVNYHSLDAKLGMPDFKIGALLAPEVGKWLQGETEVQIIESMSPKPAK